MLTRGERLQKARSEHTAGTERALRRSLRGRKFRRIPIRPIFCWLEAVPTSTRCSFVEPGDRADVGDEVLFHGDHGNFVRGLVAERTKSPLAQRTMYRVVDLASEMFDAAPASGSATKSSS
jgi:hypothetical protein